MGLNNGKKMSRTDAEKTETGEPHFLREIALENIVRLDVRTLFDAGQEPLPTILEVVGRMKVGEVLKLLVPFEPVPLFGVLGAKGFSHWRVDPEDQEELWTIYFYREGDFGDAEECSQSIFEEEGGALLEIDFRNVNAEELFNRVPEALDQLVYGNVLLVRYHREPALLFTMLGERGFGHRGKQISPEEWEIRIWRRN